MCGIFGVVGKVSDVSSLLGGLRSLEYRGYDSAGVATVEQNGVIGCRKTVGKLCALEALLKSSPLLGSASIGHTRWATHGAPSLINSHPHVKDGVAVVHNGIIENYLELHKKLVSKGCVFVSETDTEILVQLVNEYVLAGLPPLQAVSSALKLCHGHFAVAFIFANYNDLIIAVSHGLPLVVGFGDGEMFVSSDAGALSWVTRCISYLETGDTVELTSSGVRFYDSSNCAVKRPIAENEVSHLSIDCENYEHFMAKEIAEQPEVVNRTLANYIDFNTCSLLSKQVPCDWTGISRINIAACGTSYYAGLVARYWFEKFARLPVNVETASELRYRDALLDKDSLSLVISQSGETADTLAFVQNCKQMGLQVSGIVNVLNSTMAREVHSIFPTFAGVERSVASTKSFACQLSVLAILVISAGRSRGVLSEVQERELVSHLARLPDVMTEALDVNLQTASVANYLARFQNVFYLGRGTNFPLALEGALKLKEVAYIHAEGQAAGEMKHGPLALIDCNVPVVAIAPYDCTFKKMASNMKEIAARNGPLIIVTDKQGADFIDPVDAVEVVVIPTVHGLCSPMIYSIPLQLLAYDTAVIRGTNVDQPRNLAKSVTVE